MNEIYNRVFLSLKALYYYLSVYSLKSKVKKYIIKEVFS